ncbi:helix-turn-helix transcriptional regulator [Microvirga tunisiensis]|uniref:Helix-turn-helix transcriptional regulator n=1 Tax=Microvirga tunisiensis TaxID=2108360 RepID=A0A5N7MAZ4_9HYPH|nr:helix-turn-helix transcriptional regulator [Microvirga tunisiensis]MPR06297.1 helix-turn-helix transcriptional regulator [Microvirga tunisiensis]MPR24083.1 helix-turn-helix transcriptional regulator [Microvirga tunisiensis]
MTETFGSFIVKRRKELGLSQKELAQLILREEDDKPISPQYLNDIERDRRNPTSDHIIQQFASSLKMKPEYLFYLAGTLPTYAREADIAPEKVIEIFQAFRRGGK